MVDLTDLPGGCAPDRDHGVTVGALDAEEHFGEMVLLPDLVAAHFAQRVLDVFRMPFELRIGGHLLLLNPFVLGEHDRSEEHTSELQSRENLVCRLLLEKKNE